MKKIAGLLFVCTYCLQVAAQDFFVDLPKKKDDFTLDFLSIINDAPFRFLHLKGKPVTGIDSMHLRAKMYQAKIVLPAAVSGRVIQDSSLYAEYLFGDFTSMEDAEAGMINLTTRISKVFNRKVLMRNSEVGMGPNTLKQTRIAWSPNSGFFHYNMTVLINRVIHKELYRLELRIDGGKPRYYNRVMRNEPIGSFVLVNSIRNNLSVLQDGYGSGCPAEVPSFDCKGITMRGDTTFVTYMKSGFDDFPNAKTEFDASVTNIRTSLGGEYVYYTIPCKSPQLKCTAFISYDDIERTKRKTILITLVEHPQADQATQQVKKGYALELSFAY